MSRHIYDIGDRVVLSATFTDPTTEEAVEPEEVKCTVLTGDHKTLTPEVEEEAGTYSATVDIDATGYWHYRFAGVGTYKAAGERAFEVRDQKVQEP